MLHSFQGSSEIPNYVDCMQLYIFDTLVASFPFLRNKQMNLLDLSLRAVARDPWSPSLPIHGSLHIFVNPVSRGKSNGRVKNPQQE